jgi:hypothetical protein
MHPPPQLVHLCQPQKPTIINCYSQSSCYGTQYGIAVLASPGLKLLTLMPYLAHSIASVCVMFRALAFDAP